MGHMTTHENNTSGTAETELAMGTVSLWWAQTAAPTKREPYARASKATVHAHHNGHVVTRAAMQHEVAPKRGLKKAVERNKMKRQMRELYRLNKGKVFDSGVAEIWSIRYLGNRPNDYAFLEAGYLKLLEAYEEQRKKELADEK